MDLSLAPDVAMEVVAWNTSPMKIWEIQVEVPVASVELALPSVDSVEKQLRCCANHCPEEHLLGEASRWNREVQATAPH